MYCRQSSGKRESGVAPIYSGTLLSPNPAHSFAGEGALLSCLPVERDISLENQFLAQALCMYSGVGMTRSM